MIGLKMRASWIYINLISIFVVHAIEGNAQPTLKPRHFGIRNEEYAIVTDDDLKRSEIGSYPATPFDGTNSGYPYWQCFDKKFLKFWCSYVRPLNKQGSSLGLKIETNAEIHFFSHSHAIAGETCRDLLNQIRTVLDGQRYFCINGTNDSYENVRPKKKYDWSFLRLKTRSGYVHYELPE